MLYSLGQLVPLLTSPLAQCAITALVTLIFFRSKIKFDSRIILIVVSLLITLFTAKVILQNFPNSSVEDSFINQANIFASGRLSIPENEMSLYLLNKRMLFRDGMIMSQYTPGWPLLLSAFAFVKFPLWLLNPLLSVICLLFFVKIVALKKGDSTSALGCLAVSPYFIFNSASFYSHLPCSVGILAALYCLIRSKEDYRWGILSGIALSMAALIRPYTAVFLAIPMIVSLFYKQKNIIIYWVLGGIPICILVLLYNSYSTGNPYVDSFSAKYFEGDFWQVFKINSSSIPALCFKIVSFSTWVNPIIVYIGLRKILRRSLKLSANIFDSMFISLLIGYFFFPDSAGNEYGPRYLFEAFPLFCISLALPEQGKTYFDKQNSQAAILNCAVISMLIVLPCFMILAKELVDSRRSLKSSLYERGLNNSVVILTGTPSEVQDISDLVQNSLTFDDPILLAWDAEQKNCRFKKLYPNRSIYLLKAGLSIRNYTVEPICLD